MSLAEARVKAFEWRRLLVAGVDPLEQRNAERASKLVAASNSITFDDCVVGYIAAQSLRGETPSTVSSGVLR